jgi:guanosine-3',5'-bis(diphosphate) 3'-pyrophosphohydrolase
MSNKGGLVRKATAFAMERHEGAFRRKSGLPYIVHPIEVMSIVKKYKESKNIDSLLCAALLHDTLEDTETSYDELVQEFGEMAASIVQELTNDEAECDRIGKEAYMSQKLLGLTDYALVIKLADMLANCSDSPAGNMMERIGRNLSHLIANRKLTGTQEKLVRELRELFEEYEMAF